MIHDSACSLLGRGGVDLYSVSLRLISNAYTALCFL